MVTDLELQLADLMETQKVRGLVVQLGPQMELGSLLENWL